MILPNQARQVPLALSRTRKPRSLRISNVFITQLTDTPVAMAFEVFQSHNYVLLIPLCKALRGSSVS